MKDLADKIADAIKERWVIGDEEPDYQGGTMIVHELPEVIAEVVRAVLYRELFGENESE